MRNIGWHYDCFAFFQQMRNPIEYHFCFTIQNLYHCIKRCSVLTQPLPFIKRKQCQVTRIVFHHLLANNSSFRIINRLFQI